MCLEARWGEGRGGGGGNYSVWDWGGGGNDDFLTWNLMFTMITNMMLVKPTKGLKLWNFL